MKQLYFLVRLTTVLGIERTLNIYWMNAFIVSLNQVYHMPLKSIFSFILCSLWSYFLIFSNTKIFILQRTEIGLHVWEEHEKTLRKKRIHQKLKIKLPISKSGDTIAPNFSLLCPTSSPGQPECSSKKHKSDVMSFVKYAHNFPLKFQSSQPNFRGPMWSGPWLLLKSHFLSILFPAH